MKIMQYPLEKTIVFPKSVRALEPERELEHILEIATLVDLVADGVTVTPIVVRETLNGRYGPSAFVRYEVKVDEWTKRDEHGVIVDYGLSLIICEAIHAPSGWEVDLICYMDFAEEVFARITNAIVRRSEGKDYVSLCGKKSLTVDEIMDMESFK